MDIEVEFRGIIQALEDASLDYAVVGGFAVAIWGAPRATTDIDLLIKSDDLDKVIDLAKSLGFIYDAIPMKFADGMELWRVTRLEEEQMLTLDLLLVNANLLSVWESRLTILTEAGPVKVVSRDALLRMKAASGRPQDLADIARLTEIDR